jgi:hypothetical protein
MTVLKRDEPRTQNQVLAQRAVLQRNKVETLRRGVWQSCQEPRTRTGTARCAPTESPDQWIAALVSSDAILFAQRVVLGRRKDGVCCRLFQSARFVRHCRS